MVLPLDVPDPEMAKPHGLNPFDRAGTTFKRVFYWGIFMNVAILEAGNSLNDKWLAGEIRDIAGRLEVGEIGAADVIDLVNVALGHHAITCKILVGAVCSEAKNA